MRSNKQTRVENRPPFSSSVRQGSLKKANKGGDAAGKEDKATNRAAKDGTITPINKGDQHRRAPAAVNQCGWRQLLNHHQERRQQGKCNNRELVLAK